MWGPHIYFARMRQDKPGPEMATALELCSGICRTAHACCSQPITSIASSQTAQQQGSGRLSAVVTTAVAGCCHPCRGAGCCVGCCPPCPAPGPCPCPCPCCEACPHCGSCGASCAPSRRCCAVTHDVCTCNHVQASIHAVMKVPCESLLAATSSTSGTTDMHTWYAHQ